MRSGHNGSGKSAVLTALTVALGVKASATGRGSGVKNFIKEGEKYDQSTSLLTPSDLSQCSGNRDYRKERWPGSLQAG
jgi:predicted ATPase